MGRVGACRSAALSVFFAFLFFAAFTLFKFDVLKTDLFRVFLGASSKDYINIQWLIAWDLRHLLHGFHGYGSPPFYTPLTGALGFGDHIIGQSALLIPPYLLTHNTVFCYNVLFLSTFVLTGVAAYALFWQLTRNPIASLAMAVAFDFCGFRYSILSHTYVLCLYPMILFFVFAEKYISSRRAAFFVLAYACLIWQILSGMNMGLFCFYIAPLFFGYHAWVDPTLRNKKMAVGILIGHSLATAAFVAMAWPNLFILRTQHVTFRWGDVVRHSANWGNFLSVPNTSEFAMPWMNRFYAQTDTLRAFPGFAVLILFFMALRYGASRAEAKPARRRFPLSSLLLCGALATGAAGVIVFFDPHFDAMNIERKIGLSDVSLLLALSAVALNQRWRARIRTLWTCLPGASRFYALLALVCALFSFAFFFHFLYWFAPGFNGVRVPLRLLEFFQLGLCAIGAHGLDALMRSRTPPMRRAAFALALLALFTFENTNSALPSERAPAMPESYTWLSTRADVSGIIDLPFPASVDEVSRNADYVFWNTFYWLPTVAGYSSIVPRYYHWLMAALKDRTLAPASYFNALRVSHLVCHWDRMNAQQTEALRRALADQNFSLVFSSSASSVYAVPAAPKALASAQARELPAGTRVSASVHEDRIRDAVDGNIRSAWKTGRSQKAGDWIALEFPQTETTSGAVMRLGQNFMDYPRGVKIEAKTDGAWVELSAAHLTFPSGEDFASIVTSPLDPTITLRWPSITCSALRFTLTRDARDNHWSIAELQLL
jgi:hypothetical protein